MRESLGAGVRTEVGSSKGISEGKVAIQLRGYSEVSKEIVPGRRVFMYSGALVVGTDAVAVSAIV